MRLRLFLFFTLLLTSDAFASSASTLTDRERAVAVAAKHLYQLIGTEKLDQLYRTREIKTDGYWNGVFTAAGVKPLFPLIRRELFDLMDNVPMVNGRPAPASVFAKAVALGMGPLPLVPLESKAVEAWAAGPFADFQRKGRADPRLFKDARVIFGSQAAAEDLHRFVRNVEGERTPDTDLELVDLKDKLNEILHVHGIHIFLDSNSFQAAGVDFRTFLIQKKLMYQDFGKPNVIYEIRPAVADKNFIFLGHAETELGFLFLSGNELDRSAQDQFAFIQNKAGGFLWRDAGGGRYVPMGDLPEPLIRILDDRVRSSVPAMPFEKFRGLFVDTVARHEIFHKHVDPTLNALLHRLEMTLEEGGMNHERGAYLYQLETSDPAVTKLNLMSVFSVALDPSTPVSANLDGTRAALADLQKQLPEVRFWDAKSNRVLAEGILWLFDRSPAVLKKAAGDARWMLEAVLTSKK